MYMQQVLGVREVLWPFAQGPAIEGPTAGDQAEDFSGVKILFMIEATERSLAGFDLFEKMLAAMKLREGEFRIWEMGAADLALHESAIPADVVVVAFSEKLAEYLGLQRPRLELIATVSPFAVEKEPKFKRQVWDDLKRALEKAGLASRLRS